MPLVTAGYNALLTGGLGNVITHVSLHSGDPSTTGVNELTGGSPAYARAAVAWAAASGGQRSNSGILTWDVPAGVTVNYVGYWSAITAGTYYGYGVVGGYAPSAAIVAAATDVFASYAHGLTDTNQVLVSDYLAGGVPAGLTEGTIYFVRDATADTFKLAATSGGSAINVTADGELHVQRLSGEPFTNQGQYSVAVGALTLDGRGF